MMLLLLSYRIQRHTQCLYQIYFKILCRVVPEKSLPEKKVYIQTQMDTQTHRHTNIVTEKTKTLYPLYGRGIINKNWYVVNDIHVTQRLYTTRRLTVNSPISQNYKNTKQQQSNENVLEVPKSACQ